MANSKALLNAEIAVIEKTQHHRFMSFIPNLQLVFENDKNSFDILIHLLNIVYHRSIDPTITILKNYRNKQKIITALKSCISNDKKNHP